MAAEWQASKIYDRCAYLNCYNGKYSTGHKLFRFPAYSDSRHHLWIRYTGNVRVRTWASATIRRAGICANHFDPESFTNETRQSLRRHAVPKPYSCTDNQAKASLTLLAQIKSLPQKRTTTPKKPVESEESCDDLEAQNSSHNSDDVSLSIHEKPALVQSHSTDTVGTPCKVKMMKIDEQNSKSNNIVILERCKKPETCLASFQTSHQTIEKPRPHFHKIYVNRMQALTEKSLTSKCLTNNKLTIGQISEGINEALRVQRLNKKLEVACYEAISNDSAITITEEIRKFNDETACRMEPDLTNVTETVGRKEKLTSGIMKSTNGQRKNVLDNSTDNRQNRQSDKSDPLLMMKIPEYIRKKHPLTMELVNEYYRTKDERVFDRCAYVNCNKSRFTKGTRLFRFPQNTDSRLSVWIKNAGNARMLHWSWSTIRRAGLCGDHFSMESFFNETRQRLIRSAVPIPFYTETSKYLEKHPIECTAKQNSKNILLCRADMRIKKNADSGD